VSVYFPPDDQPVPKVIGEHGTGIGSDRPPGVFEASGDTAKFIVALRRFKRPRLRTGHGDVFVWPVGTEGVTISGQAKLGVHTYIGDDSAEVQVIHRDEARVEMSGVFLGETAPANFRALRAIIISNYDPDGLLLDIPDIFQFEQRVFVESYEFSHDEENIEEDFTYRIVFVNSGRTRKRLPSPKTVKPPANPKSKKGKGKPSTSVRVRAGERTLRAISKQVYKNANKWKTLYNKNKKALNEFMKEQNVPFAKLPTTPLPIGLKIYY
jgi:hypothetical protein